MDTIRKVLLSFAWAWTLDDGSGKKVCRQIKIWLDGGVVDGGYTTPHSEGEGPCSPDKSPAEVTGCSWPTTMFRK